VGVERLACYTCDLKDLGSKLNEIKLSYPLPDLFFKFFHMKTLQDLSLDHWYRRQEATNEKGSKATK